MKYTLILLVLSIVGCSKVEQKPIMEFFDKDNKMVAVTYMNDILAIVDTSCIYIKFNPEAIKGLKNYGDKLIFGKVVISFDEKKSDVLNIVDVNQQLLEDCPHIYADEKGIVFFQDMLVIQGSNLKELNRCKDYAIKVNQYFKKIKTRL